MRFTVCLRLVFWRDRIAAGLAFEEEAVPVELGAEFAHGRVLQEVVKIVADLFEFLVQRAGFCLGALFETEGAAGEDIITVDYPDDVCQWRFQ